MKKANLVFKALEELMTKGGFSATDIDAVKALKFEQTIVINHPAGGGHTLSVMLCTGDYKVNDMSLMHIEMV